MDLVSIIVPIYKVEKYLRDCIESLQAQTYKKIEILLVDDGSPDQCGAICDAYAEKDGRIRVIHKANGGLSDARNTGAEQAAGAYLFFIDGDDTVAPCMVEKVMDCAVRLDADMVFFDFESVEEETGRRDRYRFGLPEQTCINVKNNPEMLITSPSACFRAYKKEFWDKSEIRYPRGLHYEDLATTPRLILAAERIGYVSDEPLYYYMLHTGSIMTSQNFKNSYHDRTYVLDCIRAYFIEHQADKEFERELEYLFFDHGYFVPSKEIVLGDAKSPWLEKFRTYAFAAYPDMLKNPYVACLSGKDKILLFLLKYKLYGVMNLLSGLRKKKDSLKK